MSAEPLPKQADLRKLAGKQAHFSVACDLAAFSRFSGAVVDGKGSVTAELQFAIDEQHVPVLDGWVSCKTQVECQRCLEPVAIEIHSDICLGLVKNEIQARNLPKARDPLMVDDEELFDLNEMLEDELLLAMPFVSYHEPDQCKGRQFYESAAPGVPVAEKKENPFSVLESLKSGK